MAGLLGGQAHAGFINLSVDLNGVVIYTTSSTAPDKAVSATLATLNARPDDGQFPRPTNSVSLSALSNYTGSTFGSLQTTFQLNTSGAGTTAAILSIDTDQTGFLSPVGIGGAVFSAAGGRFISAGGVLSYTSDYQGANTPTLVFPLVGAGSYSNSTGLIPVGTVPSGYELSNHFLISLAKTPDTFLGGTGGIIVTVPEPASMALMVTGVAFVGLGLPRLRRKARA